MPTNNKRDVRLGVEIETTGEESVRRLAEDVRKLAKEGSDAAPEFARLAVELDKLADQSGALAGLTALTEQVEKLSTEQLQAAATARTAGEAFDTVKAKADGLRAEQARLQEAVRAANLEVVKAKGDISAYAAGFNSAGKQTAEYVQRQGQLARVLADSKTALAEQTAELKRITPAVRAAVTEETKLADRFEFLNAKAREAERALASRNKALNDSRAAALAAGAATTDLAEADTALLASIQAVADQTARLAQAQREAAAGAAEGAAAIERLERAARDADTELVKLTRSELAAEQAARDLASAARAADDALGQIEGAAAVEKLERAAKQADVEFEKLVQSLKAAEQAAEQFAAASGRAAGASADDVAATQARRRAADQLLQSERALTQEQRELAAQRDVNRAGALAEAQSLLAAAEAADKARIATERLVAASRRAGDEIDAAFGATGIRSIDAIQQEITQTEVALDRLNAAARRGAIGTNELERAAGAAAVKINRLQAEILQTQALPGTFERLGASVNGLVTKFGALSAVFATVGFAAAPLVRSFIALESTTRILTTITGSAQSAAEQIEFLRQTAQRSGQAFDDISRPYAKFAASALQTGLSLKDTQEVFANVSLAAGNLGLSSDQVTRALEALSQIASKGVVSMEELRGQLGDALPGVLPLLAKELGLTTQELNKVVESGNLLAFEAIPAIGRSLRTLGTEGGKPVEGLVAEFNRLKNAVFEASSSIADGAIGRALGGVFSTLSLSVRGLVALLDLVGIGITSVGDKIGVLAAAVATLDFSKVTESFKQIDEEAAARFGRVASRLQDVGTAGAAAAAGAQTLGVEVKKATESLAAGTEATDAQVKSLAALALANQKGVDAAVELARAAEKLVQAKKDENEAIVRTIALAGDEVATRRASALAAEDLAETTDRLAAADRAIVTALEQARERTLAYAEAQGKSNDQIKKSVEQLDKQIAAKEADAEKSEQQAAASRAAAAAAKLAADEIEDTAGQYAALAEDVDRASTALDAVIRAFGRDKAGAEDVQKATEALALAKGKLKNASDDQVAATNRVIAALKAESEFTRAQIELEITRLRIQEEEAKARNNVTEATRIGLAIKELELQATVTGTAAKRDEANAIIASTAIMLDQERQQGALTAAREQELNTIIRQQQAVVAQTDAAALNEAQQKKVNTEIRNGTRDLSGNTSAQVTNAQATTSNSRAVDGNTTSRRSNSAAILDQAAAFDELAAALRESEGLSSIRQPGDPGNRLAANGGDDLSVLGPTGSGPTYSGQIPPPNAPGNWVFDDAAYAAAGYPANPDIAKSYWKRTDLPRGPGFGPFGGGRAAPNSEQSISPSDNSQANANSAASYARNNLNPKTGRPFPSAEQQAATEANRRTVTASNAGYTITFNFNGTRRSVTAPSQSAADALIRDLEEAFKAAGG